MKQILYIFTILFIPVCGFNSLLRAQAITVSFQQGTDGYTGAHDTKLISGAPESNYGSDVTLEVDGQPQKSVLLYWDVSSIVAGSIVESVEITVDVVDKSSNNYNIYELKRQWVETEANWNEYASGQSWDVAGADGSGDREATELGVLSGSTGELTISLNSAGIGVVQGWVDNPGSNQGFIVLNYDNASNGLDFSSREMSTVAERPKLTVTYSEGSPTLSLAIDDVTVTEGNSGNVNANFTVSLSSAGSQIVTVNYATADGTATAGSDYVASSDQVSFQPGETSQQVIVQVNGDIIEESDETFLVELTSPVNATLSDDSGQGTIIDDDNSVNEYINVPTDYPTIQDAIDAAADGDNILVAPGIYSESIVLFGKSVVLASWFLTTGDTSYASQTILDGGGSSAVITIENSVGPSTAIIGLTIQNGDDGIFPFAKFDLLNCRIINNSDGVDYEGGSGGLCKFNIFENNSDDGIDLDGSVDIIIENNIIRNNNDDGIEIRIQPYTGTTLNYIMRNNEIYGNGEDGIQLIDYDTISDRFFLIERNLIHNNVMAGIGCMSGSNTVENYEGASIPERIHLFNNTFVANDYGLTGGDNLVAVNNIFIDHPGIAMKNVDSGSIVSYGIHWNNGTNFENTNIDSSDFLFSDPLLDNQFRLQVNSPAIDAGVASFIWQGETVLDLPSGSYSGTAPDLGAFEFAFQSLSIDDVVVTEGNSGTVDAIFTVMLSGVSNQIVTVSYTTADGSATAGSDYVAVSGQVSFFPGETTQVVKVMVNGDMADEPNEMFLVNLSNAVNATIGDNQGTGTITDDDAVSTEPVTISFQDGVNGYNGTRDTKLLSGSPGSNYGSDVTLEVDGQPARSVLLYWDVSSIAAGSVVESVDITVNVVDKSSNNYNIYESMRLWVETEATWNEYASGQSWEAAGADGSGDRGDTELGVLSGSTGELTISLNSAGIGVVQGWVDNPGSNQGFIILNYDNASNGLDFSSREVSAVAERPKLTVTYSDGSPPPPTPSFSIDDVTVTEGNSGTVDANFTVTLSAGSSQTVTVNYATADGTATAGSDYVAASDQLTFTPGQTSQPVTVVVNGDVVDEPNETFFVNLTNPVNATISDAQGTGTITDDDGAPTLSIDDVTVTEGNSGTVNANFTVTLSAGSSQIVTVNYATADGTATAGSDYVAVSGQISFQPGQSSGEPVTVQVNGDVTDEPNETFFVNLSNAVNATIADNQGSGAIINDDSPQESVTVSFQDGINGYSDTRDTKLLDQNTTTNYGTAVELELDGSPDASSLVYWDVASIPTGSIIQSVDITVNVTNSSSNTYEIYEMNRAWVETEATWNEYALGQSWERAGADGSGDRGATELGVLSGSTGELTISLNSTGISVVQGWIDNPGSNNGFIFLDYINASNGLDFSSRETVSVILRPKLTITYIDEASLFIDDIVVTEGDSGTVNANFTVSLSGTISQPVTVDYNTSNGSAVAGSDYIADSGQISFLPGETSQLLKVEVKGDVLDEANETFFVNLSNVVNATIAYNQGTASITDDDPTPSLSIDDVKANEGAGSMTFLVNLSETSGRDISVDFTTTDSTAIAPDDYTATSGTLTIPAGSGSSTISFGNIGDFGDAGPNEENVANMLLAMNPEFIFTNGDNNYSDGAEATWEANVLQYYGDFVDAVDVNANRFYASLGNHDYPASGIPIAFLNGLALPEGQGNERYYDFVKGAVHFYAIDSNSQQPDGRSSSSIQAQWLQTRLAASTSVWNIVYLHHAPWSSGSRHGSQNVMQWPYDAWGADVVFAGHDHIYERILKDEDDDGKPILYFVNGLGGRSKYDFGTPLSESVSGYNNDFGAMFIRADSNFIMYEFHSVTEGIIDRHLVTRQGQLPPPHIITIPVSDDTVSENSESFIVQLSNAVNAVISDNQGRGIITDDDLDNQEPPESITVSFQDGVEDYSGTRDTKLISGSPDSNYGNDNTLEIDGQPDKSVLLYWDVSSLPSGSVVQSVAITINVVDPSSTMYEIYELKRAWDENQATWNDYASGQVWQVDGADGSGDRGSIELGALSGDVGIQTISLNSAGVAVIQSWVDNPGSNQGLIFMDYINASNGLDFSSRETSTVANRPKLTVTYTITNRAVRDFATLSKFQDMNQPAAVLPETVELKSGYPNPFNLETNIEYVLPEPVHVKLAVYNVRGQQVRLLVNEVQAEGFKNVLWNGRDNFDYEVGSGVYIIQLIVAGKRYVKKLSLQK